MKFDLLRANVLENLNHSQEMLLGTHYWALVSASLTTPQEFLLLVNIWRNQESFHIKNSHF